MDLDRALVSSIVLAKREDCLDTPPDEFPPEWIDLWDHIVTSFNKTGRPPREEDLRERWDNPIREYPLALQLLMRKLLRMSHGPLYAFLQWSDSRLPDDYIKGPTHEVIGFVKNYVGEYGNVPSPTVLKAHFPTFKLLEEPPAVDYVVDRLRERHLYNTGIEAVRVFSDGLKSKDPRSAWVQMREAMLAAEHDLAPSEDMNFTDAANIEQRIRDYEDRKASGGIQGIPWFLPGLTKATLGKAPGQLILVVARQGIGKTWFTAIDCHHAWETGFRPLYISKEMSVKEMMARLDARHARVPHSAYRSGHLGQVVEPAFYDTLRRLVGKEDLWVIGDDAGAGTVTSVASKVAQYRPDIVYIDAAYMLGDELNATAGWERLMNIMHGIKKKVARAFGIPVVVSLQFSKAGKGLTGTADDIALSDVAKAFDEIIGLYQDRDMRERRELEARQLKQREGAGLWARRLRWDFETMSFEELRDQDETSDANPEDPDDLNDVPF